MAEYAVAAQFVVVPRITAARSRVTYPGAVLTVAPVLAAVRLCDHAQRAGITLRPAGEGKVAKALGPRRPGAPGSRHHTRGGPGR